MVSQIELTRKYPTISFLFSLISGEIGILKDTHQEMLCGFLHYKIFHVARFKMNLLTIDLTANGQDKLRSYEIKYLSYNVQIDLLNQFEKYCDFPMMKTQSNVLQCSRW